MWTVAGCAEDQSYLIARLLCLTPVLCTISSTRYDHTLIRLNEDLFFFFIHVFSFTGSRSQRR